MSQSEIETITMPVISTGHLTEEVAKYLTELDGRNPWIPCASWEYGFFMYLENPSQGAYGVPPCLLDIWAWLVAEGFDGWVRLDEAAARVEALPFYDW